MFLKLINFQLLGCFQKPHNKTPGESGGNIEKESSQNTSSASCSKDAWNKADVLKSSEDAVQTSLCFFRFPLLVNTFPHGLQIKDFFF